MRLLMYVDGREVDAISLEAARVSLSDLIEELKKKHKALLKEGPAVAEFILEGIPSSMNGFQSLLKP